MIYKPMVNNLLASIDWEQAAANSFQHFHARGLHYVNLLRNPRLTVKLYIFDKTEHNDHGWIVWPHNHRYAFTHVTLLGSIWNHKFRVVEGNDWRLYTFDTPLDGGSGLTPLMDVGLERRVSMRYSQQGFYDLDPNGIHTISIDDDYAAALLLQYHDQPRFKRTAMLAPVNHTPVCDGASMYHKINCFEARSLIQQFLSRSQLSGTGYKGDV